MKYKISDVYISLNDALIRVGVVVGPGTEFITNSEYEAGLKSSIYGIQIDNDCTLHCVGKFVNYISMQPVHSRWIRELEKLGYDTSNLKYLTTSDTLIHGNPNMEKVLIECRCRECIFWKKQIPLKHDGYCICQVDELDLKLPKKDTDFCSYATRENNEG